MADSENFPQLYVHCQACDAPLSIDEAESGLCGPCAVEWMEAQDHE